MPNALHFSVHRPHSTTRDRPLAKPRRTRDAAEGLGAIPRLRRILVATDGTPASHGALTMAGLLARHNDSMVNVVSVLPRWGPSAHGDDLVEITRELLDERLAH